MAEFDDKLNAILSNPEIMGQIMSMAGAMGQSQQAPPAPPPQPQPQTNGGLNLDPAMIQSAMALMQNTQIDPKQQNLIQALHGYLPDDRLQKLEKAMQAAKLAKFASSALGNFNTGR